MRPRIVLASLVSLVVMMAVSEAAQADVQHVVAKGHTLQAIANRYRVTPKSILAANHMKDSDARHLQVGEILTIPNAPAAAGTKGKIDTAKGGAGAIAKVDPKAAKKKEPVYAQKPKTPGVVHVKRIATTEEADVRIVDRHGKVQPAAVKTFEKLMRSPSGAAHPVEPRLLALLTVVSNHFGSRKIEIVSGFRPYSPTQYTAHSNHNHGKAVDFRIPGVPNEVLRDYCRTLKKVGCGYYPNSVFVHMDARAESAFWIDYSRPGEAPRYNAANVQADEGTSDVREPVLPSARDEGSDHDGPAAPAPSPSATPTPSATPAPAESALPPAPTTPLDPRL